MDVLFVNADSSLLAYQELSKEYSAIEPPTWSLLLAESCRSKGFKVGILDCDAEKLTLNQSIVKVKKIAPRLIVFVVYGQNPNSGTTSMIGSITLAKAIKNALVPYPIGFLGSHVSALPLEVLSYEYIDIVFLNEGVYALHNLLSGDVRKNVQYVKGIGYKRLKTDNTYELILNDPEIIVPQNKMDIDLPGYAWDLLPYNEKPLDLYRAHFWHAGFDHNKSSPFAAIYTSLGCNFECDFCMINIVNRTDNSENIDASHSSGMRHWSVKWVIREMSKLSEMNVLNVRISDEMFLLNQKVYTALLEEIVRHKFNFNMWVYARVDTIRPEKLDLLKRAGVRWIALGIETGNQNVRNEVSKGSFKKTNVTNVCDYIHESGINIIANYMFGLPEDTQDTMQQTLDLAIDLNTEMANMYPCQALPGSPLYNIAKKNKWPLPTTYSGYAFLSYDCQPLPTRYLSSSDVLRFRDYAWHQYFTNQKYLDLIEEKFGSQQRINIEKMTTIKLKRKIT